jgi:predicted Zn finger-like uncharacterized protein
MKIVCQNCSATYKIADDKVQGKKVFKIKCKKCGEDILVRGTDAPAEAESPMERPSEDEATRVVSNEGTEPIWHAVLNGDQQGPFSIDQLRDLMGQGQIDTETYVWRDGFDGWLPMRDVVELAMLTVSAAPPAPTSMPAAAAGGDLFGAAVAAAEPRSSRNAEPAKARAVPKGGDLFAPEARAEEAAKPAFAEAEKPAPTSGADSLTGQRNENSVLFSLATLQQLSDKNAKPAAPSASDASGLIDINKLAGALNSPGAPKKSSVDDIMSVGASSGMASPLAAPVLAPVAVPSVPAPTVMAEPAKPQGVNKTILATGVAVAAILVGGGVGAAWLVSRNGAEQQQPAMAANTTANTPPVGAVAAPTAPPSAAPAAPTMPEAAPSPSAAPAAPAPSAAPAAGSRSRDRERERGSSGSSSSGSSGSAAAPSASARTAAPSAPSAPAPAARPSGGGSTNIDDLLNRVGGGGGGSRPAAAPSGGGSAPAPAAAGGLPETPDRGAVRSALSGLSSSVRACGTGTGGTAMVTIVFANTGRVTTATVGGIPPGPAVGCIVGAVRRASLPPFTRSTFSVTYPYPIN